MKDCRLIATIPSMVSKSKVNKVISNEYIYGVRWNSGISTPYSEYETIEILAEQCKVYKKRFWVDLKGRQLRVAEWGNPLYSAIKLNHNIEIIGKAVAILRGEKPLNIISYKENCIYVDPLPKHSVGAGQSINIIPINKSELKISGYLTNSDIRYLDACKKLNIKNIMASFVEDIKDIVEIKMLLDNCNIVCKIESMKGVKNLSKFAEMDLMAARDDLYIELNNPYSMTSALKDIIKQNKNSICASRIFSSLENSYKINYSDFEDLENMYSMGYRNFMLCDNISNYYFEEAIEGWKQFINN